MVPGAYHWLTSASASSQLDHYLGRLDAVGGPEGLLCALDVEDTSSPPNRSVLTSFVEGFASRTGGHPLLLYSGYWWWRSRCWTGTGLTPYLWDSRYVSGSGSGSALYAKVPASWWTPRYGGWEQATLLQYSSSASVTGKKVDISAYLGSLDQLKSLTTSTEEAMTDLMDADPYGALGDNTYTIAGEIRNAAAELIFGTNPAGTQESGVVGRLTRIEGALADVDVSLTDEQVSTLGAQLVSVVGDDLDARIEAALRRVLGGLDAS